MVTRCAEDETSLSAGDRGICFVGTCRATPHIRRYFLQQTWGYSGEDQVKTLSACLLLLAAVCFLKPAFQHAPNVEMARLIGLDLQRAYAGLKQYAKAAAISDQLVERYPKDPEILFQASRLHADRAYQMMRQLIQADANSVW